MKKVKIDIEGMNCASCASNIEQALTKVSGVKSVKVSSIFNKAFLEVEDFVKEEEIKKAVENAGYTPLKIEFS